VWTRACPCCRNLRKYWENICRWCIVLLCATCCLCGVLCLCGGLTTLKMQCLVPICMLKDNVHLSQDHTISTLGSLLDSMLAEHANALFALFESLLPLGLKTAVLDWFRFCASPPRFYPLSIARLFRAATMSRGLWSRGTSDHLQTHMVLPFFLF
jgi:hypothetical protein